jgi:hypothetical protein
MVLMGRSSVQRVVLSLITTLSLSMGAGCGSLGAVASDECPPDYYHRPAVVRGAARTGAVVGEVCGVLAWVPLWPITKGLALTADEPFGYSQREWMMFPVTAFASLGHYALGLPAEALYFVCWGAWVDEPGPVGFDHVPGDGGSGRG